MNAVLQHLKKPLTLDVLAQQWKEAKHAEEEANARRVEIETAMIALAGEPEEGAATHELMDGSKLTITSKITRTVDESAWRAVMARVPEELRPITFVETAKLDVKGLRWLRENRADLYAIVAQAVTAKKAKSAVTVRA